MDVRLEGSDMMSWVETKATKKEFDAFMVDMQGFKNTISQKIELITLSNAEIKLFAENLQMSTEASVSRFTKDILDKLEALALGNEITRSDMEEFKIENGSSIINQDRFRRSMKPYPTTIPHNQPPYDQYNPSTPHAIPYYPPTAPPHDQYNEPIAPPYPEWPPT